MNRVVFYLFPKICSTSGVVERGEASVFFPLSGEERGSGTVEVLEH